MYLAHIYIFYLVVDTVKGVITKYKYPTKIFTVSGVSLFSIKH